MTTIRSRSSRRSLVLAAALAVGAVAAPAAAAPPLDTYEVELDSASVVPGGTLAFHGTCYTQSVGPLLTARVELVGPVPDTSSQVGVVTVAVDRADASFRGSLPVPADTPEGDYQVSLTCRASDFAAPGQATIVRVVTPPPVTTTSTTAPTTTTAPSTSTSSTSVPTTSTSSTSVPTSGPTTTESVRVLDETTARPAGAAAPVDAPATFTG